MATTNPMTRRSPSHGGAWLAVHSASQPSSRPQIANGGLNYQVQGEIHDFNMEGFGRGLESEALPGGASSWLPIILLEPSSEWSLCT